MTTITKICGICCERKGLQLAYRTRIRSTLLAVLAIGCITISKCLAFQIANPYSNKFLHRLKAATGAEEDVSSSSTPFIETYDRQEFEMQVGRAMDTLRDDYPDILVKDLDYSIYHSDLELIDPSGVHLHGLKNYENAIRLVHTMVGIFYCPDQSDLKFRMCFDKARQNIRIHWNARVVPKAIFGGYKTTLHVDGISIYELDRLSGNITQHRLERLVMNDDQVSPEQGVFAALRTQAIQSQVQVDGIPSFHRHLEAMTTIGGETLFNNIGKGVNEPPIHSMPENVLHFRKQFKNNRGSVLFGEDENMNDHCLMKSFTTASSSRLSALSSSASSDADGSSSDQSLGHMDASNASALEKKNIARKKFGLKPINMEEFLEVEKQVKELGMQQQRKAAAAATEAMEIERARQQKENRGGFLGKLLGNALKDTCESNYDCERPEVCCDFGVKKMCCSSGLHITDGFNNRQGQLAEVPVPIHNPNPYPGDDPRNRDPYF